MPEWESDSRVRVLYMGDDAGLARVLQKKLEPERCVVDLARDGEEGLSMHKAASYDVLLVDHSMPVRSGLDVIRVLVRQGARVPMIMVTDTGREEIAVEAMKLGANDYVVRDVEGGYLELLPAVVQKVIREDALREEGRQSEEALKESEELLRRVIDTNPNCIFVKDGQGRYVLANEAIVELYGISREAMLGKSDLESAKLERLNVKEAEQFLADDLEVINTRRAKFVAEERFTRLDGTTRWFQTTKVPLTLRGVGDCLLGVAVDITERKRADRLREELEEQIRQKQKMEAVGLLAGGVAHEFNNMLTVIQGNAELAQIAVGSAHPVYGGLCTIHQTAQRATRLTRQLLAFSQRRMLRLKVLDVNELIRDFAAMVQRVIGEKIQVCLDLAPEVGAVLADAQALQQVLMNLTLNGRDAMPEGGTLHMLTAAIIVDDTYCGTHPEVEVGEYVRLSVSDTGVGMDEATRERLFEPFFTTKAVGEGTGLSLATVYGIVKQHSGWIDVQSKLGKGTRFDIHLPVHRVASGVEKVEAGKLLPMPTGTETILLAEDEPAVREFCQRVLERLGYTVLVAADGEEAVEVFAAQQEQISLVILDAVMPGRSGPKAYEAIRALREDVPVLFMTGYSEEMAGLACEAKLGRHVLHKPFAVTELARRVREAMDVKSKT